jgi:hypothetical protein
MVYVHLRSSNAREVREKERKGSRKERKREKNTLP